MNFANLWASDAAKPSCWVLQVSSEGSGSVGAVVLKFIELGYHIVILYCRMTGRAQAGREKTQGSLVLGGGETEGCDRIGELYAKFMALSSQVTIEHDLSAFNMIEYNSREMKMDFDQQLIVAKLKRLENNAELKRINMELEHRRKKTRTRREHHHHPLPEDQKYLHTYREFVEERTRLSPDRDNHSDSDDEPHTHNAHTPARLTFFNELSKHPKVLEFTLDQIHSKELLKKELASHRHLKILQFRDQVRNATVMRKGDREKPKANGKEGKEGKEDESGSPEKLAENIFRRLYTKKNKERPMEEVKRDKRLSQFVSRQEMIVETIDQRSLSKELHKKLRERLNNIANELYLDQRKRNAHSALPNLSTTLR